MSGVHKLCRAPFKFTPFFELDFPQRNVHMRNFGTKIRKRPALPGNYSKQVVEKYESQKGSINEIYYKGWIVCKFTFKMYQCFFSFYVGKQKGRNKRIKYVIRIVRWLNEMYFSSLSINVVSASRILIYTLHAIDMRKFEAWLYGTEVIHFWDSFC